MKKLRIKAKIPLQPHPLVAAFVDKVGVKGIDTLLCARKGCASPLPARTSETIRSEPAEKIHTQRGYAVRVLIPVQNEYKISSVPK